MKIKVLAVGIIIILLSSLVTGCLSYNELFKETNAFVESLYSEYESYGIFGGEEHAVTTSDGLYRIMPVGRLINVKINKVVDDEEYEKLRQALENHYKNDSRVNSVYIAQAGTVMIDCRN